ncbi:Protein arginine N-methyltransferase 1 [Smittium mucronatum]|uniref:type I protein arginine methyltransferase n=1 Tax=Smittium mucronatum TaxID=133383 RepID=A0A1R0H813_9FUNG|nr:Protein arginine N-methyltransferase 1 [Smittium mucronatum]
MSEQAVDKLTSKDYYFDSYAHFGIHEEMLKDKVRTNSYKDAILNNKHLFKDKIVLDVGCGTGILSMFAAKAGAKHVMGVDMSNIIDKAQLIIEENGFAGKITLLKGKMEEVILPYPEVDIIISEWMGYFLLYESMLDTVLVARDKYLVPGGLMFPDKASMIIAGIEDGPYKEEKISFWDDVYGFKMSCIKETALNEPLVDVVGGNAIVTTAYSFKEIDLKTVTKEELSFSTEFKITALCDDYVHAFISWFDIWFSACHKPVYFSTGPKSNYTHWKQTVFYTKDTLTIDKGDSITGTLTCRPNGSNPRDLDISIEYNLDNKNQTVSDTCIYRMS